MAKENIFTNFVNNLFKKKYSVPPNSSLELGNPKKFLIIRQHNQLGDLLATVPLFRAIKEKYPESHLTVILSPVNYQGLVQNKYIDKLAVFNKKKLINPFYFIRFFRLLKMHYDVVIVPSVVSISFTSNLLAGMSNAKIKIGPESLQGTENKSAYFFDRRVNLDWSLHPELNVYVRVLDVVKPFGITTKDYTAEIHFGEKDLRVSRNFIKKLKLNQNERLVGLHVGAGKPQNRWPLAKFVSLVNKLEEKYDIKFYLTGSNADDEEISYVVKNSKVKFGLFLNKKISEVAALISLSNLFITNDTGVMHVAGATDTPQISIFGPTNPYIWAPYGKNKRFVRKSDLIADVSVEDVFKLADSILAAADQTQSFLIVDKKNNAE